MRYFLIVFFLGGLLCGCRDVPVMEVEVVSVRGYGSFEVISTSGDGLELLCHEKVGSERTDMWMKRRVLPGQMLFYSSADIVSSEGEQLVVSDLFVQSKAGLRSLYSVSSEAGGYDGR